MRAFVDLEYMIRWKVLEKHGDKVNPTNAFQSALVYTMREYSTLEAFVRVIMKFSDDHELAASAAVDMIKFYDRCWPGFEQMVAREERLV